VGGLNCRYLQQTDANLLGFGEEDEGDEEGEEGDEGSEEEDEEEEDKAAGKKAEKKGKAEVRAACES
jgi:hypothetical protein